MKIVATNVVATPTARANSLNVQGVTPTTCQESTAKLYQYLGGPNKAWWHFLRNSITMEVGDNFGFTKQKYQMFFIHEFPYMCHELV